MNKLEKVFQSFKGLDLRTSDILRGNDAATELQNMTYRQTGAMSKRKGYKHATDDGDGCYGLTTYNNVNLSTGAVTEEVISIDDNLNKMTPHSFTITYTGTPNSNTYYTLELDAATSTFKFKLYDDTTLVLNSDLGDGSEGSPVLVSDLTTAINAETNFSCTSATGGASEPAAYIPSSNRTDINTTAQVVFNIWSDVTTPNGLTTPFSTFYAQRTNAEFENATFSEINDVLYIATGHDNLMKYDGSRVYRAGLPQAAALTVADSASGTAFAASEVHSYLAVYEYTDAKQNVITGIPSAINTHTQVGNKDIDVTVTYLTDTDFNIDQCTVNGAQASVNTITVTDSSDMQVGDFVYIDDGVSGDVVSRKITAIPGGTSITVDGAAVTVSNSDIISTVRISLYRTEDHQSTPTAPTLFYLVKEFVNDSGGSTTVFQDAVADTTITGNAQWVDPIKAHGLPPKCKYIDEWRGQLIMSGDLENVTTTYYSDVESPEYFPPFDQSFLVDRKIMGLKALDNALYIFKKHSVDGVTGDFASDSFQVDKLSREGVGCAAHATIQEVQGALYFLSERGVYSINNEGLTHIGSAIEPKFAVNNPFSFKQAIAYTWQADKKYVLFMPTITSGNAYANNATSETYAFDYFREAWLEWANFNLMGGMTEQNGQIFKASRDDDADLNTQLHKISQSGNAQDYADHATAISFTYKSPWFTLGEPSVWKKYLRCKIHSYDTTINDFENDSFSVRLRTEHDYNNAKTWADITYDFSGGSEGWGLGPWGEFPWGELRLPQLKRKLASKKVRSLRVILSNTTALENVLISGLEFDIATPYKAEGGLKE
jgi:hypothetical protein